MKKYFLCMAAAISALSVIPAMAETSGRDTAATTVSEAPADESKDASIQAGAKSSGKAVEMKEAADKVAQLALKECLEAVETATKAMPVGGNRWNLALSEEDKDLLARITMLEAGGESDLGQQAVIEVILNRVASPVYPNSVYGVLSQVDGGYRQFSTWKNRNSRSAQPSERVRANVEAVLTGQTSVLPFQTVYFSRRGENSKVQARIGGHVFCNR